MPEKQAVFPTGKPKQLHPAGPEISMDITGVKGFQELGAENAG
jgi:hypothetical protein